MVQKIHNNFKVKYSKYNPEMIDKNMLQKSKKVTEKQVKLSQENCFHGIY